jgi:serine/threonine protein kinase
LEEDRDRAFASILLELGIATRAHIERALAARVSGDERPLGRILLANGWIDEQGYLRATDAQRAREALGEGSAARAKPDPPSIERIDLEQKRRAARAAVQKGAMVADAAANAPFLRRLMGKPLGSVKLRRLMDKGAMAFTLAGSIGEKPVRVKVLRPDMSRNARALARFERECAALARVEHPSVARVLDHGVLRDDAGEEIRWFATESDDGETLAVRLARERVLDPNEVVALGQDVASGLAAAHRVNVIHRDVRPETIFVTAKGAVRIFDFSVTRDEESSEHLTLKGQILGAAEYAAPELATGEPATPAVDVYALGITLYVALTGALPYGCRSVVRLLTLHASAPIPWANRVNRNVPRPLAVLVRDLLAKKPGDRPSMSQVAQRLGDPRILDPDAVEPDECVGCGADTPGPAEGSTVPVCPSCVAQVEARERCGGCVAPLIGGTVYAGRAYCAACAPLLREGQTS